MKRILSIIIAALMIASSLLLSVSATDIRQDSGYTVGDVDGSGTVNAMDSFNLKATIAGTTGAVCDSEAADFDADGKISAMDSFYMKSYMAGAISDESFESGYNVYKLLIGGYEITDFCIVVPEGATAQDNAHYAAERMQYYIEVADRKSVV